MTILKKDGTPLVAKIDAIDLEKVQNVGTWFAEWHKDFNSYLVQNISLTKVNKKSKPLKQSLQTVVMDTTATTPVRHINGDTLDNRRCNLEVFRRTDLNEIEEVDENTIAIILKDKYGNVNSKALISIEDLNHVITNEYTWVNNKVNGEACVIANTPNGRIHLDRILMNPDENKTVHHINLNPLDNRRENLELTDI
ncbi:hypothetical protein [Clostridium sp.]|uniref:hypothetical protein n=1 Tax=Clostridium sp. TaxID=1506 RepID=UPI002FCB2CB2